MDIALQALNNSILGREIIPSSVSNPSWKIHCSWFCFSPRWITQQLTNDMNYPTLPFIPNQKQQVVSTGKILTPTGGMRWKLKKMAQFLSSLGRTRSRCIAFCGLKPSLIATVTLYELFFSCCLMKCDLPQPAVIKVNRFVTRLTSVLRCNFSHWPAAP